MRRAIGSCFLFASCVVLAGTLSAQYETPEQYRQRAGSFYETKYLPEAVAQVSKRAGLTKEEGAKVTEAFRSHIYRYLKLQGEKSCFSRTDWDAMLDGFDRSVATRLTAARAAAVKEWRLKPRPEGNALGFLFYSPWMQYATFDEIVTKRTAAGAVDCGFETMNSGCAVDQCVLSSVKQKVAFRAMYAGRSIDSQIGDAIVGAADGTGVLIRWDSMGSRVMETPCRFAIGRSVHGGEHVDCE